MVIGNKNAFSIANEECQQVMNKESGPHLHCEGGMFGLYNHANEFSEISMDIA